MMSGSRVSTHCDGCQRDPLGSVEVRNFNSEVFYLNDEVPNLKVEVPNFIDVVDYFNWLSKFPQS